MYNLEMKRIPSSLTGQQLHLLVWQPEEPVAVLQIVHGMAEHIARYDEFARWMCERNVAVIGHSHLGHGLTASGEDDLGFTASKNGWAHMTGDIHNVRLEAQKMFPGLPHFILGHSMGSFLTRTYLTTPDAEGLAGVIISGTGNQPAALMTAGKCIAGIIALFRGKRHRSAFINSLSFGGYNKSFEPGRTEYDWLSKNEENIDRYIADPRCGFCFTTRAFSDLFTGLKYIGKASNLSKMPKYIPCLFISGQNDPVGENGKGVEKAAQMFRDAGMTAVEVRLYADDRHEVLNETDREQVFNDIYDFMGRCPAALKNDM